MLEDLEKHISEIFYAILASNETIMLRNAHTRTCISGEPYDDDHYDEEIEMKQPDVEPPPESDPPLEVTAIDEESP